MSLPTMQNKINHAFYSTHVPANIRYHTQKYRYHVGMATVVQPKGGPGLACLDGFCVHKLHYKMAYATDLNLSLIPRPSNCPVLQKMNTASNQRWEGLGMRLPQFNTSENSSVLPPKDLQFCPAMG